jgi:hypothetical protein
MPPDPDGPDDEDEDDEESRGTLHSIAVKLSKVGKWWKLLTTIGTIVTTLGGIGVGVWKVAAEISDLHDTIKTNKAQVTALSAAYDESEGNRRATIEELVSRLRATREHDQEVITNLRIAVAALQAAQAVRSGQASYAGVGAGGAGPLGTSSAPPPNWREREEQIDRAERDARNALIRASNAQTVAEHDDPLAGLPL